MMQCVYCIGCRLYRRDEQVYCEHPDKENCQNRSYWESEDERLQILRGNEGKPSD